MGKKRDSVRTLPDGRKVVHHPDGEQDLMPTGRVARRLASDSDETSRKVAELRDEAVRSANRKRDSLGTGDSVPSDKRPV